MPAEKSLLRGIVACVSSVPAGVRLVLLAVAGVA